MVKWYDVVHVELDMKVTLSTNINGTGISDVTGARLEFVTN